VHFSPFYPHGSIPVPLSEGYEAMSVEGIWQALKVFEHADMALSKMRIASMSGIKRSARSFGPVHGHRAGVTHLVHTLLAQPCLVAVDCVVLMFYYLREWGGYGRSIAAGTRAVRRDERAP